MVRPVRSGRDRKDCNRRTRRTKNGNVNCRHSRSHVRKLHKTKSGWRKSGFKGRTQDTRRSVPSKNRRKSAADSRKCGHQRRRTSSVNKSVTLRKNGTSLKRNSRTHANSCNGRNKNRVSEVVGNGQRKRRGIESETEAASKKARLTLNGKEVALSLSNSVLGSGESSASYSAPHDNIPKVPPITWNLLESWEKVMKDHPPAYALNNAVGKWGGNQPAPLRNMKMAQRSSPTIRLPAHKPPVTYTGSNAKKYLDTAINRCYVYSGAVPKMAENKTHSVLTAFRNPKVVNDDPFGRPGFFESCAQEYYLQLAMSSPEGRKALEALNNVNLFITEVNFQYKLEEKERLYLGGRWRQHYLVEIFKPRYIVVGLKYDAEGNKLEINGCFPKREISDIYWALRGPHTPCAVYNINYTN